MHISQCGMTRKLDAGLNSGRFLLAWMELCPVLHFLPFIYAHFQAPSLLPEDGEGMALRNFGILSSQPRKT